jgi:DNA-binding LytR/AlgR family response regulator
MLLEIHMKFMGTKHIHLCFGHKQILVLPLQKLLFFRQDGSKVSAVIQDEEAYFMAAEVHWWIN